MWEFSLPLPSLRDVGIHAACHIISSTIDHNNASRVSTGTRHIDSRMGILTAGHVYQQGPCVLTAGGHIDGGAGILTAGVQITGCNQLLTGYNHDWL